MAEFVWIAVGVTLVFFVLLAIITSTPEGFQKIQDILQYLETTPPYVKYSIGILVVIAVIVAAGIHCCTNKYKKKHNNTVTNIV